MGESVLITGASTGLGREMALYLAECGFEVYATMRDVGQRDSLEAAAQSRHIQLRVLRLDVTDGASIAEAAGSTPWSTIRASAYGATSRN